MKGFKVASLHLIPLSQALLGTITCSLRAEVDVQFTIEPSPGFRFRNIVV